MFFDNNILLQESSISEYLKDINNNYSMLIEAARISEMRYYNDTGKDLFIVNESAFTNLLEKFIRIFKQFAQKLKEIFNKVIESFDKKRYENTTNSWKHCSDDKSPIIRIRGYDFSEINWNPFESIQDIIDKNKSLVEKKEASADPVELRTMRNRIALIKGMRLINIMRTNIGDELLKTYFSESNIITITAKSKSDIDKFAAELEDMEKIKKQYKKTYLSLHQNLDSYIFYLEDLKKEKTNSIDNDMQKILNDSIAEMKNLFTDCTSVFVFIGKCYLKHCEQLNEIITKAVASYNSKEGS